MKGKYIIEYANTKTFKCRSVSATNAYNDTVPELQQSLITQINTKKQLLINELSSYRPVAQMPFTAKLLERHVSKHLAIIFLNNNINDPFQSVYRPYHSTETAVVTILTDLCLFLIQRSDVVLCLLSIRHIASWYPDPAAGGNRSSRQYFRMVLVIPLWPNYFS